MVAAKVSLEPRLVEVQQVGEKSLYPHLPVLQKRGKEYVVKQGGEERPVPRVFMLELTRRGESRASLVCGWLQRRSAWNQTSALLYGFLSLGFTAFLRPFLCLN